LCARNSNPESRNRDETQNLGALSDLVSCSHLKLGREKKKKPSTTIPKKSFKNRLLALLETTKKSSKTKV
jgi:hypothetical protein